MPRPCAVELHARRYSTRLAFATRCHGLAPWSFTFDATQRSSHRHKMPRPCAVERHVWCYSTRLASPLDATALRRGASRLMLPNEARIAPTRLASPLDATALRRGASRLVLLTTRLASPQDATALRRGASRLVLLNEARISTRCHGLAPWSFTFGAKKAW